MPIPAKLTKKQKNEIIDIIIANKTQDELAQMYGVSRPAISQIWQRYLKKGKYEDAASIHA